MKNTTLNLIWQTRKGEQTDFEFEYTTDVLFKSFTTAYFFDEGSYQTVVDNAVIIYSNDSKKASPEFIHYLNKFRKKGFRFYLLHYSNEGMNHDYWYYAKANYVFRNYFDPAIKADNVLFIPLGFKSGYLNKQEIRNDCSEKTIDAAFAGQPKADRFEMIAVMKTLGSHYLHETTTWNCPTALSQIECIDLYKKTRYAPCPMGNVHPDSFRICESLEWGCIPVVRKVNGEDYFSATFGKHPFEVVDSWDELSAIVEKPGYCDRRKETWDWYMNFKTGLQSRIKVIIDNGGVQKGAYSATGNDRIYELQHRMQRLKQILRKTYRHTG